MIFPDKTIYLAGPITGLSYETARLGWRKDFASMMPPYIHAMSPMRGKDYLMDEDVLAGDPDMYPEHLMSTPSGIVCRDRNDVKNCDVMVANFLEADVASIGTSIEFGWADAFVKPIVMVVEPDGIIQEKFGGHIVRNPHFHAMMTEMAGYVTNTVEEAANVCIHLLTPGV
jgi:nucleoside 2-deoxyribosyltransferase